MLRKIRTLSIAFITLLVVGVMPAQAATIKIDPVFQEVEKGDTPMITAVLTGAAGSLNSYSFDITFDPSILGFANAIFLNLGLFQFATIVDPGVLRLTQNFGFFPLPLIGPSESLVKVTFDALHYGISPIGLIFDPFAIPVSGHNLVINHYPVTPYLEPGTIKVPEPGIVLLLGIGLAGVMSSRRKMALQA